VEMLIADGLDAAIIGVGARCGQPDIVAYNVEKVLEILVARDGMTYEEALEFYEFNIAGAWVGDQTPLWVRVGEMPQPCDGE
jgi:hypothetical protein|tara:strand:- start:511 stop:756 length:246 start_codon:yes stop_codon:yes gene_type:complete